jgi:hypothetical protein
MDVFDFDDSDDSSDSSGFSSSSSSLDEEGTPYRLGKLAKPLNSIVESIRKLNTSINVFTVEQFNDLQILKRQLREHSLLSQSNCTAAISVADQLIENIKVFITIDDLLEKILKQIPNLDDKITDIIRYIHPPTFELFLKKHEYLLDKLRINTDNITESCAICLERPANISIVRNCTSCEKYDSPVCRCTNRFCLDCLLKTFYTQSDKQIRSYGTCPSCRSHFCLDDLVNIEFSNNPKEDSSDKKRSGPDPTDSPKRIKL